MDKYSYYIVLTFFIITVTTLEMKNN